ncbi:hypothetical protein PUMCH_002043 [Australozyma saopauloensis]|uniref:Uncharacterized protein n=1 Tax=Australozyma saopauloensis TaxID=291208 RepID=A0AAX4H8D4_9ASCO|nr:hypothetical protein PUMCH_002043 [[Candida] saopauloensis]
MLPPTYDERPPYSPSLELYGLAFFKVEKTTPWTLNSTHLQPVLVELHSNQIRIYKLKAELLTLATIRALYKYQNRVDGADVSDEWDSGGSDTDSDHEQIDIGLLRKIRTKALKAKVLSVLKSGLLADFCENKFLFEPTTSAMEYSKFAATYRGLHLHTFTLLNLSIGKAPYIGLVKKQKLQNKKHPFLLPERNVLRLRVEYMQILLHIWSFHGMVNWYRSLVIGRDLAQHLDSRKLLILKSLTSSPLVESEQSEIVDYDCLKANAMLPNRGSFSSGSISDSSIVSSVFSQASGSSKERPQGETSVTILGHKLRCLEDYYLYFEKRYIGNCLPALNSYEKWHGCKVAISNCDLVLVTKQDPDVKDNEMFMLANTFIKSVNTHRKRLPEVSSKCKEFYVYQLGLYTCKEKKQNRNETGMAKITV